MRRYELMLLLRPDLEDDKLQSAVEKVTRAIVNGGGSLSKVSPWGKRRLAYPIKHLREASYFLIHFDIEPGAVREIERGMLISEEILRYLVTVIEDRGPAPENPEPAVEPRAEREEREQAGESEQETKAETKSSEASTPAESDGATETAAAGEGGDAKDETADAAETAETEETAENEKTAETEEMAENEKTAETEEKTVNDETAEETTAEATT